ncbi:MAG: XRE family transcriptional regulator [Actinomycetota bacterium]|nr:XRE family transcriptional regulator [Actinomycetota bacterium]
MLSDRLSSGIADLDDLMEGLILGDNIVWVVDEDDVVRRLEDALLVEAVRRRQPCYYVTTGADRSRISASFPPGVMVLDARPKGPYSNLAHLEATIVEGTRGSPPGCVVIDGLAALARRRGTEAAVAFFSRLCPRLFDLGAIAYWRAHRRELGRAALAQITSVTQCVLELGSEHLRVVKAEGRSAAVQGRLLRMDVADDGIHVEDQRALGRLGQGLERLRKARDLSQSDLARMVGVTPSAISQAEAGRRGLSLETLLLVCDRTGISLDELLSTVPTGGYVLGRRPRGIPRSTTALLGDPKVGLRADLIQLKPGESGGPDRAHKGAELVLLASGLVQVTIGADTPVLRAGDAVLATTATVSAWRNLLNEPAMFFWVVRD